MPCKTTSRRVASLAGRTLANEKASKLARKLAGSALSQRQRKKGKR